MRNSETTTDLGPEFYHVGRERQLHLLRRRASGAGRPYIEKAFDRAGEITMSNQAEKIKMILGFAAVMGSVVAEAVSEGRPEVAEEHFAFSRVERWVVTEEFVKQILPRVEQIRQEIWGTTDPPFSKDPAGAFAWLQSQARAELRKQEFTDPEDPEIKIYGRIRIGKKWYRGDLDLLPFEVPKGKTETLLVPKDGALFIAKDGRLARLLNVAHELVGWEPFPSSENAKPFRTGGIVGYIMTGVPPSFVEYHLRAWREANPSDEKQPRTTRVELTTWRPLGRGKEMKDIYAKIKKTFGRRDRKDTKENQRLYKFVEDRRREPTKGRGNSWVGMWQEWNRRYPKNQYACADCLRIAYQRIVHPAG